METRNCKGGVTPCFLFCYRDILQKKTHLREWMKLSEGDFSVCLQGPVADYMITDPRLQQHDWLKLICSPLSRMSVAVGCNEFCFKTAVIKHLFYKYP